MGLGLPRLDVSAGDDTPEEVCFEMRGSVAPRYPNGLCTGAAALSLPGDPTLRTSGGAAGALHFEISRGAPLVDGVRFDVIWRVVDPTGNTVLESTCLTVTVK